jgi:hypothetical protein
MALIELSELRQIRFRVAASKRCEATGPRYGGCRMPLCGGLKFGETAYWHDEPP